MSEEVARLLSDSARLLKRSFDLRARALGVTREQSIALATLARNEGVNQVRFAELLEMETIALCRLVDRLEASGLVRRERNQADRRARRLFLTQDGWAKLDQLRPLVQQLSAEICAGISPEDLETFRTAARRIIANMTRDDAQGASSR